MTDEAKNINEISKKHPVSALKLKSPKSVTDNSFKMGNPGGYFNPHLPPLKPGNLIRLNEQLSQITDESQQQANQGIRLNSPQPRPSSSGIGQYRNINENERGEQRQLSLTASVKGSFVKADKPMAREEHLSALAHVQIKGDELANQSLVLKKNKNSPTENSHTQKQQSRSQQDKVLFKTGTVIIDGRKDTNLSSSDKIPNAFSRQEILLKDDTALEDQAAAQGFSFSRSQKLRPKIVRNSYEDDPPITPKKLLSNESQQLYTQELATMQNLLNQSSKREQEQPFSEPSSAQRQMWDQAINIELEEIQENEAQKKSKQFLVESLLKEHHSSIISQIMIPRNNSHDPWFAKVIAIITVLIHSYNYFTCLIYMGIEGFPEGIWLIIEILTEVFMVAELFLMIIMRTQVPQLWQEMKILHKSSAGANPTKFEQIKYALNAVPTSLILSTAMKKNYLSTLTSFGISCVRIAKLLRFDEIKKFVDTNDIQARNQGGKSFIRIFYTVFYFFCFLHLWATAWLTVGRIDWSRDVGWYKMAKFQELGPDMSEMYMESFYFCMTRLAGAGLGNINPSTNFEFFWAVILDLTGSSLFMVIFVDFIVELAMRDMKKFKSINQMADLMQFSEKTQLPDNLVYKIRYYFKEMNNQDADYALKKQIIHEMPPSIQGQVSVMLNQEIIQSVKFFQKAPTEFIEKISILLNPQIYINDDYICRMNEPANKMYFVHSGYVEILCRNGISPLVYFGKGSYFGEIGMFLSGKRTVSVRSKSNSVLYQIEKEEFFKLLDDFPDQKNELLEVAQTRLQTTPFDNHQQLKSESDLNSIFKQTKQQLRLVQVANLMDRSTTTFMSRKPWLTYKLNALSNYIIFPFSPIWWIWNILLITAIIINSLMVPYQLGFEQDYTEHPLILFCLIVYIFDIPVKLRTGISHNKISIDSQVITRSYLNKWLMLDVLAVFPFEHVFLATGDIEIARYLLLLRLLKVGHLYEVFQIIQKNSRHSYQNICFFSQLFLTLLFMCHWYGCIYGWLSRREYIRNPKYDGNSLFEELHHRPFHAELGKFIDLPIWSQYKICLYVGTGMLTGGIFGDIIPQTNPEQIVAISALILGGICKTSYKFNVANYLGNLQQHQLDKNLKSNKITEYMKACKVSSDFKAKIDEYTNLLRHGKSRWEGSETLKALPVQLQNEIKVYLETLQTRKAKPQSRASSTSRLLRSKIASENQVTQSLEIIEPELKPDLSKQYSLYLKMKHMKEKVILLLTLWNFLFIPLQFAYKLEFKGVFLAFEIITIVAYLLDLAFYYHTISWLSNLDCVDNQYLRRKDQKIKQSDQLMRNERISQFTQIGITLVASIPMSLILTLQKADQHLNMYVIVMLSSLRLIKFEPLSKFFREKQKDRLALWKIISSVICYYLYAHFFACIMILLAYWEDWSLNWLRRCPVPQESGTRTKDQSRDDLSDLSIYIHALYYMYSIISNVSIGDITGATPDEMMAQAIAYPIFLFIQIFLFADIVLLVTKARNQNYSQYMQKRFEIIQKLKSPNIPKEVVDETILYLDYQYATSGGVSQEEVLKDLSDKLKFDFLFEKYKSVVDNLILLRVQSSAEINLNLAGELLQSFQTQIFMHETFIIQVGQSVKDAIFVLDGLCNVVTISNEMLGVFQPGDYYATDLDSEPNSMYDKKFFFKTQRDSAPKLQLDPLDNFNENSLLHIVATQFVTIGYISREKLDTLFRKFPGFKSAIRKSNRYLFDLGRKAVEVELHKKQVEINRNNCMQLLRSQYENSTAEENKDIIRLQRTIVNEQQQIKKEAKNISRQIKLYWIGQMPKDQQKQFKDIFRHQKKKVVVAKQMGIVCFDWLLIVDGSWFERFITYTSFVNRIYILITTFFYIGFLVDMEGAVLIVEIISHFWSVVVFILRFRMPVLNQAGELTVEFEYVTSHYMKNGMMSDILSLLPFNLILPIVSKQYALHDNGYLELSIIIALTPLRLLRLLEIQRLPMMFDKIKFDLQSIRVYLTYLSYLFLLYMVMHVAVCSLAYLCNVIEHKYQMNYFILKRFAQQPLWAQYIRGWYGIGNIVSTVGSGDSFGTTDLERIFFILLIGCADVFFSLAFGLVASITSVQKEDNPDQNFCAYVVEAERIMSESKFNDNWKDRVQQYMTYAYQLRTSTNNLNAEDLKETLPDCLIKEILYYSNRPFLTKLLNNICSENIMRDLAYAIIPIIHIPDDIILEKSNKIEKFSLIVEGTCASFNKRNSMIEQFSQGQIIGEQALLKDIRPKFVVRAQTFMLIRAISKFKFEEILNNYPEFYKKFLDSFEKPASEINPIDSARSMRFGLLGSIDMNRDSMSQDSRSQSDSDQEGSQEDEMNVAKQEEMFVNLNVSTNLDKSNEKLQTHEKMPHMRAGFLDYGQSKKYGDDL